MGSKLLKRTLNVYKRRRIRARIRKVHPRPDYQKKSWQQINKPVIDRLEALLKTQG